MRKGNAGLGTGIPGVGSGSAARYHCEFFFQAPFSSSPLPCVLPRVTQLQQVKLTHVKGTIIISDLLHSPAAAGKVVCLGPAEMGVGDSSQPEQVSLPSKAEYK